MNVDLRPAGDRAWLVEPADRADLPALARALRADPPAAVQDVLPAAATVLVTLAEDADPEVVAAQLRRRCAAPPAAAPERQDGADTVLVPVRYDGEDLDDVAAALGLTREEVVDQHTGTTWRCAFVGFAPGFGYLTSPDGRLGVPRRAQSRTAVPAGAVALADGWSAVYPRRSPGGWQLIGTTTAVVWDLAAEPPALLQPGTSVRFVAER
ncbi:allophanate hydrolase subunit 1 [Kineococcus glutinatus]|uniref:Allophanate hydrolase subunit 1 n=1 Tax=Kineococcus glutinatus TaxID=1070872 RepID=A0ABP9HLP9_9ACTN